MSISIPTGVEVSRDLAKASQNTRLSQQGAIAMLTWKPHGVRLRPEIDGEWLREGIDPASSNGTHGPNQFWKIQLITT
jgi:hypothetical protein